MPTSGSAPPPLKLAIVASHPIQYQAGLFRRLAARSDIDLTVLFCWDFGIHGVSYDVGFGREIQWDLPLTAGYHSKLMKNLARTPSADFAGQINPTIVAEIVRGRYDAVVVQGYSTLTTWFAMSAAVISRAALILRGESDLLVSRASWKWIVKRPLLGAITRVADAILYSCTANRNYFRYYGAREEQLFFFPCAVDNAFWLEEAARWTPMRQAVRVELGIPPHAPVVLVVGKLTSGKRPMDVLRAVRQLSGQEPWLVYVGDGSERDALERAAAELCPSRVVFAGFQNQRALGRYYAVADVFVMASQHDKSPKSMNEAMNFGLPIVASDQVSTALDLVRDGENGRVYPVGDVAGLRDALEWTLDDTRRLRLGDRSRQLVSGWTFDRDVAGLLDALDSCVPGRLNPDVDRRVSSAGVPG